MGMADSASYAGIVETLLIAGLVLVVLVVLAVVAAGVALVVWLRHLWRRARRSRAVARVVREVALARPLVVYRDVLRLAPPGATDLTIKVQRKALTLEAVGDQLEPQQRFRVEETTRRYLPDTMDAYRMAVMDGDPARRRDASRMLVQQLSELDGNLDSIAAAAGDSALAALRANGLFLGEVSRRVREQ